MELGSWELHIFVSLAVILGTAFVALVVDYLKGSNEQLREHNIELRVRTEETERRAILDPDRNAQRSLLSALRNAVEQKPAAATAELSAKDSVEKQVKRPVTREAPSTLVPLTVEPVEAKVARANAIEIPAAQARPSLAGELLEQVIAATPGHAMGGSAPVHTIYQEVTPQFTPPPPPPVYEEPVVAEPVIEDEPVVAETVAAEAVVAEQLPVVEEPVPVEEPAPVAEPVMKAPAPVEVAAEPERLPWEAPVFAERLPERPQMEAAAPETEEEDSADRVVFVTPVEVEDQDEIRSRPLLHQFEVIRPRPTNIADVPEDLMRPIRLRMDEETAPAAEVEPVVAAAEEPQPEPAPEPVAAAEPGNSWTSILYDSNDIVEPAPAPAAQVEHEIEPEPEPEAEIEEEPKEWFREPDSYRTRYGTFGYQRPADLPAASEEPAAEPPVVEPAPVEEPAPQVAASVETPLPEPEVVEPAMVEPEPEPVVAAAAQSEPEEEEALENVVVFAPPVRQPEPVAPAAFSPDFDVVYSQPVEEPVAQEQEVYEQEEDAPAISGFQRVPRSPRPAPIAWPKPVARPEPIIFSEPAMLPNSQLKPEPNPDWDEVSAAASAAGVGQPVPVFAAPRALEVPAGYHDSAMLDSLCRDEGLFSGLVVSIGINDYKRVQDAAGRSGMEAQMQSVISLVRGCAGDKGFACRTAEDEFIIVHANESGPAAQRRLSQVSERLWDFQLRSLGMASIMFSSGSVTVEHERLGEAVTAANERMYQTKRSRKTVNMETGRQKRVVNG